MAGEIVKLRNGLRCRHEGNATYTALDPFKYGEGGSFEAGTTIELMYSGGPDDYQDPMTHKGAGHGKEFDVLEVIS